MDLGSLQTTIQTYSGAALTLIGAITAVLVAALGSASQVIGLWGGMITKKI